MKIKEALASIVFPPRCPVCDEVIHVGKDTCDDCCKKVVCIGEPVCKKCGKPLENQRREYCSDCARKQHYFSQGKAVFVYQGEIRQSMYRFKYSNCRTYGKTFVEDVWKRHAIWLQNLSVDAVVPVPMYRKKEKRRGYNQAEVLAHGIAQKLGCPVETKLVVRAKNTVPLKSLNDTQRKKNLENAFKIRKNGVKLNKILLIDDIYTTGSTLDGVTTALLAAGVQEVYCLTICAGQG